MSYLHQRLVFLASRTSIHERICLVCVHAHLSIHLTLVLQQFMHAYKG